MITGPWVSYCSCCSEVTKYPCQGHLHSCWMIRSSSMWKKSTNRITTTMIFHQQLTNFSLIYFLTIEHHEFSLPRYCLIINLMSPTHLGLFVADTRRIGFFTTPSIRRILAFLQPLSFCRHSALEISLGYKPPDIIATDVTGPLCKN